MVLYFSGIWIQFIYVPNLFLWIHAYYFWIHKIQITGSLPYLNHVNGQKLADFNIVGQPPLSSFVVEGWKSNYHHTSSRMKIELVSFIYNSWTYSHVCTWILLVLSQLQRCVHLFTGAGKRHLNNLGYKSAPTLHEPSLL